MAEILHFEILRKHGQTNTQTHKHTNKHTNTQTDMGITIPRPPPVGGEVNIVSLCTKPFLPFCFCRTKQIFINSSPCTPPPPPNPPQKKRGSAPVLHNVVHILVYYTSWLYLLSVCFLFWGIFTLLPLFAIIDQYFDSSGL